MLYLVTWFRVTFRTQLSASQLVKKDPSSQMKRDGSLLYALLLYPFKSSRSPLYQLIRCVIRFNILLPPSCGSPKLALAIQILRLKFSGGLFSFVLTRAWHWTHTSRMSVWLPIICGNEWKLCHFYHAVFCSLRCLALCIIQISFSVLCP
jgi:hypothetical protein